MPKLLGLLVAVALAWGGPALARGYEGCGRPEIKLADAALDAAARMAVDAALAVGDTTAHARWFGPWSAARGEATRDGLKAVAKALAADELIAVCLGTASVDCKDGTYAYVEFARDMAVNLCPSFFAMPSLRDAAAGRGDGENGTREGTIIHEVSHFPSVAGTEDHCYARSVCAEMALRDPVRAAENADSFQYFAEDVTLALLVAKDE